MKVKKILAFASALAMIGASGMNVFAEEAVTAETEAATEVTTEATTEVITETTKEKTDEIEATENETEINEVEEDSIVIEEGTINEGNRFSFDLNVVSFYADRIIDIKERTTSYGIEYDQYNYVSIFLADGTPTNIQDKLIWIEYGRTGGFAGYDLDELLTISDDKLTICCMDNVDTTTTYSFDKATNIFIDASSETPEEQENSTTINLSIGDGTSQTFTIGDETFTASISGSYLKITNSRGQALSKPLYDGDEHTRSVSLSINGNTLNIKEYDEFGRLLKDISTEYNSSTNKFGELTYNNGCYNDTYYFDIDGVSFYAEITTKVEGINSCYDYITVYFANGTKTNIQDELVFFDPYRTNGRPYYICTHISASGNKVIIRYVDDIGDASKDILKTYTFDKASNSFILQGTEGKPSDNNSTNSSTNNTTANSPATGDTMAIPAVAGSAIIVLGAVICVSKKRK